MSAERGSGVIVAFDYGERRIGVATGNRLTATASALGVAVCRNGEPPWDEIDRVISEWGPGAIVTGRPPIGNERLLEKIANFVHALEIRYKLPVHLVDESQTSQAAAAALARERREGTRRKRVKRGDVDQLAACLIAERWLTAPDSDD